MEHARASKSNAHVHPRPVASSSAWQANCCRLDRPEAERLVGHQPNRRSAAGVFVEPEETLVASKGAGPWQAWMQQWEERQRALLRFHEEAMQETTRTCVGNLKFELLERLERLEKLERPKQRPKNIAPTFISTGTDKEDLRSNRLRRTPSAGEGEKKGLLKTDGVEDTRVTSPVAPVPSLGHRKINDAITGVLGGHKNRRMSVTNSDSMAGSLSVVGVNDELEQALSGLEMELEEEDYVPQGYCRQAIFNVVHHRFFSAFSGALVLAYAFAAGIMSDIEMRASLDATGSPAWRWVVDLGFTAFFLIECVLKLIAEGLRYFKGKERAWNIFDFVVAVSGLLDVIAISSVSFGFLRVLRTFRAIRVLRIMRLLSFFKDLRLMVASILCCLLSLGSAFTLLIAVMYIFAVILLQSASEFLRDREVEPEVKKVLSEDFGNMLRTTYSLSQAVSGGRSWGEFAEPFIKIHAMYGLLFTLFVAFVVFGVLNILTGVFVESTASLASVDKELVIQEQLTRNQSLVNQIRRLFKEIDQDNSGTLTYAELKKNLKDERVKAYFSVLQMDVSEAYGLFQLLDQDDSGEVSIEEFIMTCMRLKGTARSIDLASMLADNKRLHQVLKRFMNFMQENFADLTARIKTLQSSHEELLSDGGYY